MRLEDMTGTLFPGAKDTNGEDYSLIQFLDDVENGECIDQINDIRSCTDEGDQKKLKSKLKLFVPGALFKPGHRKKEFITKHTGVIICDFDDGLDIQRIAHIKDGLQEDLFTIAAFVSPRGKGLKTVHCYDPDQFEHIEAFRFVGNYFKENYGIDIDKQTSDVNRGCFMSYDKELIRKETFEPLPIVKEIAQESIEKSVQNTATTKDQEFDGWINFIEKNQNDFTTGNYKVWLFTCFAIAGHFGENGRSAFHRISKISRQYNKKECDYKYTNALKTGRGRVPLNYLYCVTGFREYPSDKKQLKLYKVMSYLQSLDLRLNELTGKIEMQGNPIKDRGLNSLWTNMQFDGILGVSFDFFCRVLFNNYIESYHPFSELWESMIEKDPGKDSDSEILKLINHFTFDTENEDFIKVQQRLILRWLLAIPATLNGEISELIMVLIGPKGNGKTEFFRRLLPENLSKYFATSKLDKGKDSDLLMTEKLIILDDEFAGRTQKNHAHFKALASSKYFSIRRAYARINEDFKRTAILCGTSNPDNVIYDNSGGNRRILPIKVKERDFDLFDSINRELLICQLCHLFQGMKNKGEEPQKLTYQEKEALQLLSHGHYVVSAEEDLVAKFVDFENGDQVYTPGEIADHIQGIVNIKVSPQKIGEALTKIGAQKGVKKVEGKNGEKQSRKGYKVALRTKYGNSFFESISDSIYGQIKSN